MPARNEELPVAVEIQQTEEQLHIWDGLAIAMRDPGAVLDAILVAEDFDAAMAVLRERLALSEVQATAVLGMQFRHANKLNRQRIAERRDELSAHLEHLRRLDS